MSEDWEEEDDGWDNEDWYEEAEDENSDAYDDYEHGDELDDEAAGPCPECGAELHVDAEVCNACGYWLTTEDRHKLWDGGSSVRGMMGVGKVLFVITLIALLSGLLLM